MEKKTRKPARKTKRQIPDAPNTASPLLRSEQLGVLLSLRHPDPHQILGPHLTSDGLVIRAFRPDAKQVEVVIGKRAHEMQRTHDSGVFEVFLAGVSVVPTYRFRVLTHAGHTITLRDPYSFLPTIGELDLHLFAEGRHEAIYEKLGAHVTKVGTDEGRLVCCVGAASVDGVSVVGRFNGWDGRRHQMRCLVVGRLGIVHPELDAGHALQI